MDNMKNDNLYRTTVTTLRPGHSTETHVLKVWNKTLNTETPYKVHVSKSYHYICEMERGYLARKITPISP